MQIESLVPNKGKVLVKILKSKVNTIGGAGLIQVAEKNVAKPTLALILRQADESYYPCGKLRQNVVYQTGETVKIPAGNVGDTIDEAPDGEEWIVLSEDVIICSIKFKES